MHCLADRMFDEHDHSEDRLRNLTLQLGVVNKRSMRCSYLHVVQIRGLILDMATQVVVDLVAPGLDPKLGFRDLDSNKLILHNK